jgi:hypothetical protein
LVGPLQLPPPYTYGVPSSSIAFLRSFTPKFSFLGGFAGSFGLGSFGFGSFGLGSFGLGSFGLGSFGLGLLIGVADGFDDVDDFSFVSVFGFGALGGVMGTAGGPSS